MTRVFGVDYQFLSCGSVFTDGLVHAAQELGIEYAHADWSDGGLNARVQEFAPDLLFVVHGRRWSRRGATRSPCRRAVWLLDEPYEVDDTATFSTRFDHVFLNDPATCHRHAHATVLPVCYDPRVHCVAPRGTTEPRTADVGFIGGANQTRERYLAALADAGLLSYVIGGVWSDPRVTRACLWSNIPPAQTAEFYRRTRIVLNVFRERHHFNRNQIPASALNPRVYEATACGALVVSEWRPEVDALVPELPTFRTPDECVRLVTSLLADPAGAEMIRLRCAARLQPHTYAARLRTVLTTCGLAVGVAA
jgi:hypothetical protein